MKIILNILAADIMQTDYFNGYDCAITRAIRRAGYSNASDNGTSITLGYVEHAVDEKRAVKHIYSREELEVVTTVSKMYLGKNIEDRMYNGEELPEVEDISLTLDVSDDLLSKL